MTGYGRVIKSDEVYAGFFENNKLEGKGIVFNMLPDSIPADAIWEEGELIYGDQDITDFTNNEFVKKDTK